MTPTLQSRLRTIALHLAIGALCTLLITAASTLWWDPASGRIAIYTIGVPLDGRTVEITDVQGATWRRRNIQFDVANDAMISPLLSGARRLDLPAIQIPREQRPLWRGAMTRTDDRAREAWSRRRTEARLEIWTPMTIAHGWPLLALECRIGWSVKDPDPDRTISTPPDPIAEGGILMDNPGTGIPPLELRAIPLRPLWPGLLLNTVFFALAAIIPRMPITAAIRLRRYTRGLCPRCEHDRQHRYVEPCPKCGERGRHRP